ncbi:MAG: hypothetical protein E4H01_05510 [Lysobacterales bacterium]|nr:MAG: hypothetical protein E4H01_05510 [Xanthomonadales bacterium]
MVRMLTKAELEGIASRGGQVDRLPQKMSIVDPVTIEGLQKLFADMMEMKRSHSAAHQAQWEKKFAKMDQLITAVKAAAKGTDLGPVMKMMADIQAEHKKIAVEHAALKVEYEREDESEDEGCAYKLTGRRDQRGLIDLEYGLTFTPVK